MQPAEKHLGIPQDSGLCDDKLPKCTHSTGVTKSDWDRPNGSKDCCHDSRSACHATSTTADGHRLTAARSLSMEGLTGLAT